MDNRLWTKEQDQILRENYYNMPKEELMVKLNRCWGGIKHRASRLHLKRNQKFLWNHKDNLWFEEENEIMRKYYYDTPIEELEKLLPNRTRYSIYHQGQNLKLERIKKFSLECLRYGREDKNVQKKRHKAHLAKVRNPKYKREASKYSKKLWKDPEYVEKTMSAILEFNKKLWDDPLFRKKIYEANQEVWQDPEFRKKVFSSVSEAARKGSKRQKYTYNYLVSFLGEENVKYQDWSILKNKEIDISIPDFKVGIEYDGPSHFHPIYGKKSLLQQQNRDRIKNKLLKEKGWTLYRVCDPDDNLKKQEIERICNDIVHSIKGLENIQVPQRKITDYIEKEVD